MRERRCDVLMTTLYYADVLGQLAGALGGIKAIYSWETSSAPEYLVPHRLLPYRFSVRFSDRVVAVSQAVGSYLRDERHVPQEKITVIPYGVDLARYNPEPNESLRKELGFSRNDVLIGMVGRLEPDKGHDILIEAASRMKKNAIHFALAGQGSLEPSLKEQVRRLGLEDQFTFLGFRRDIQEVLKLFDIVTLPSLHEGLPNAILEAMAVGKPVVATDVGGIGEAVVHQKTGLLINPGSVESLETGLSTLIEDAALRVAMGEAGRYRMEEVYSLDKQVESFEQLLSSKMPEYWQN
jgi:glycosyltransferase involved in cell wall biosynthesis